MGEEMGWYETDSATWDPIRLLVDIADSHPAATSPNTLRAEGVGASPAPRACTADLREDARSH